MGRSRLLGSIAVLVVLTGCHATPAPSIADPAPPPEARELPIGPATSYQLGLDLASNELQATLRPTFGVVQTLQYTVPATTDWNDLRNYYRTALPDLSARTEFPERAARYRLFVLGTADNARFLGVALVDPPGPDPDSLALLVSRAYR